jgi:hypothetical protein
VRRIADTGAREATEAMRANIAAIVADAWEEELRTGPDPMHGSWLGEMLGMPRRTYRERLHEQKYNMYGELIPRIVTVRRNLRMLGRPLHPPRIPD